MLVVNCPPHGGADAVPQQWTAVFSAWSWHCCFHQETHETVVNPLMFAIRRLDFSLFTEPQAACGEQGRVLAHPSESGKVGPGASLSGPPVLISVACFEMWAPGTKFLNTDDRSASVSRPNLTCGQGQSFSADSNVEPRTEGVLVSTVISSSLSPLKVSDIHL